MTKKHFIALADVVRDLCPPSLTTSEKREVAVRYRLGRYSQWNRTVEALASFCQSQNGRFNRERWIDYVHGECGPNGGKV